MYSKISSISRNVYEYYTLFQGLGIALWTQLTMNMTDDTYTFLVEHDWLHARYHKSKMKLYHLSEIIWNFRPSATILSSSNTIISKFQALETPATHTMISTISFEISLNLPKQPARFCTRTETGLQALHTAYYGLECHLSRIWNTCSNRYPENCRV